MFRGLLLHGSPFWKNDVKCEHSARQYARNAGNGQSWICGRVQEGSARVANFCFENVSTERTGETPIDMMQKQAQHT